MSATPHDRRIEDLLAKQEIAEVLHRYCRGTDRGDRDLLRSCFHPDSEHVTDSAQAGSYRGPSSGYVDRIIEVCADLTVCTHLLGNVLIEVDGDRAVSEARFLAHHCWSDGASPDVEQHRVVEGRYLDRLLRRDGAWKIIERRGVHEFNRVFALPRATGALDRRETMMAPHDPVYALLRSFDR